MKRKILVGGLALFVLMAAMVSIVFADDAAKGESKQNQVRTNQKTEKRLSKEQVKQIAAEKVNGTIEEIELEREKNNTYYEVEINDGKKEHELKIDAVTGEVFKHEQDWNDDRDDWNDDDDDDRVNKSSNIISSNNASNIAAKTVDGRVLEIELDEDDGRLMYEVELWTSKGEAEVEIDAYTGKVLSVEYDD